MTEALTAMTSKKSVTFNCFPDYSSRLTCVSNSFFEQRGFCSSCDSNHHQYICSKMPLAKLEVPWNDKNSEGGGQVSYSSSFPCHSYCLFFIRVIFFLSYFWKSHLYFTPCLGSSLSDTECIVVRQNSKIPLL